MNKISIPAFVENFAADTENAKYSKAKLKVFYIGETVDHRVFTKEFSDKILSTIAYTPVVGYYSVADEDFLGHNNVQHIYGIVPADPAIEYVEEDGVTFAVTDIILYTGRTDEIGTVASKIVGKQHSLELDPATVQYRINKDETGNFQNVEFISGELVGLSVLGDNERPAFSGSEFFSAVELPDFITDDNKSKYQALFNAMFTVEPTGEEVLQEIRRGLEQHEIWGWVCEHVADQYVVIENGYYEWTRYWLGRDELGALTFTKDNSVRPRFLSDAEIEILATAKKGTAQNFEDGEPAQDEPVVGTGAVASDDTSTSIDGGEPIVQAAANEDNDEDDKQPDEPTNEPEGSEPKDDEDKNEEFEALRSSVAGLESANQELTSSVETLTASLDAMSTSYRDALVSAYGNLLTQEVVEQMSAESTTPAELAEKLANAFAELSNGGEPVVEEIIQIGNTFVEYNECDPAAVIAKYINK